jgi:hypothetical protein
MLINLRLECAAHNLDWVETLLGFNALSFHGYRAMPLRAKVQECIRRVRSESRVDEKLNGIADPINAFVDYVEQMGHLLRNVESRLRRMG